MNRIASIIAGLFILALASMPAAAQNCTTFTAPAGDSTNKCASTGFVANAGASGHFTSGVPWCDPTAVAGSTVINTGAVDATPYFNTCRTTLENQNGGILFVPPGSYCLNNFTISATNKPIWFMGSGVFASTLIDCFSLYGDATVVTLNSTQHQMTDFSMVGGGIIGASTFGSSFPTLDIGPVCVRCTIQRIRLQGGLYGMRNQSSDAIHEEIEVSQWYGSAGIYRVGLSGIVAGSRWSNNKFDGVFPFGVPPFPGSVTGWAPAIPITAANFISSGGYIYQVQANCTTGGAPPTLQKYGTNIIDGTCIGQLVGANTSYVFQIDSNVIEDVIDKSDAGGPGNFAVYALTNTIGGGSAPGWIKFDSLSMGGGNLANIYLNAGHDVTIANTQMSTCLLAGCAQVWVTSGYTGNNVSITGGTMNLQGAYGVLVEASANVVISNVHCTTQTTSCFHFAAGVTDFTLVNSFGNRNGSGACFTVAAGASNRYVIENNDCNGSTGYSDGGTGTIKTVCGNGDGLCPAKNRELGMLGSTSGVVTIKTQAAAGTYNFNLPTSAGTSGQPLLSGGGGGSPMSFNTLGVAFGGTNLTGGTSGGLLYFSGAGTIASSAAMAGNQVMIGQGAGAAPTTITNAALYAQLGYPQMLLNGPSCTTVDLNPGAPPTDTAVNLTLPTTNYRISSMLVNNVGGATASLTTAQMGVFTQTGGGGITLAAAQALSAITSSTISVDRNTMALTAAAGSNNTLNDNPIQARVTVAQGTASTPKLCVYGFPMP